ncbi:hypothetical protein FACS1894201_11230 [Bacteroidia bacterium]|nr:hypothetical protein FACS1894201_11230 [Bacteroidia bacterium]
MKASNLFFTILISAAVSTTILSQSNAALDKHAGFKDLKLGDPLSKWENELVYWKTDGISTWYHCTSTCCRQLFQFNLIQLNVRFENNMLADIVMATEAQLLDVDHSYFPNNTMINSLKMSFQNLFGKPFAMPSDFDPRYDPYTETWFWQGNNVSLLLKCVQVGGLVQEADGRIGNRFYCVVTISISDNSHIKPGF